jgi:hypothetical protein
MKEEELSIGEPKLDLRFVMLKRNRKRKKKTEK